MIDIKMKILGEKIADKGFFINLGKSSDRLSNVNSQIDKYKIENLHRFEALNDELIQSSATKSHRGVFELAKSENLDVIFVAEDDFQINDDCDYFHIYKKKFITVLNDVVRDLDNIEWDVILLGCNPKTSTFPVTSNLATVCKSTGAWAYLIKKRAYEYVLENFNYRRDYLAIDDILPMLNFRGFKTLTTIPMMVSHATGYVSTLQPRGPVNYTQWIQGNYELNLYSKYSTLNDGKINIKLNNIENDVCVDIILNACCHGIQLGLRQNERRQQRRS
jgi:GR25 family glycosyltransferase involved in LPS biosynthesis